MRRRESCVLYQMKAHLILYLATLHLFEEKIIGSGSWGGWGELPSPFPVVSSCLFFLCFFFFGGGGGL